MSQVTVFDNARKYPIGDPRNNPNDLYTQLAVSLLLGVSAFLSFCFGRTRWEGLYAARKRQTEAGKSLPDLPDTAFGWIPALYRVSHDDVLVSAGLDAFVLLTFIRMAITFLAIAFFLALVVIFPVHMKYLKAPPLSRGGKNTTISSSPPSYNPLWALGTDFALPDTTLNKPLKDVSTAYLWMYVVFVYTFSGLALYLVTINTRMIIKVRQSYLGSQSTVTDRTFRLSGIPNDLRSEDKIKEFVEGLEIGKVESVTLCRKWKEIDELMDKRNNTLRKLEEAWTVHLNHRRIERNRETLPLVQPAPPEPTPAAEGDESSRLLSRDEGDSRSLPYDRERPSTRVWHGFMGLRSRKVDAIDYYEEHLRKLDKEVEKTRKKDFTPTSLAFVTMDSIAACQMAIQAILDPSPLVLLAKPAPAPPDVVWQNTYIRRRSRMIRSWIVTIIVILLTVFWVLLLAPVAALTSLDSIHKVWPALAHLLESNAIVKSLVQTGLPTLVLSLLNIAVPYLYDWLANLQGMISQDDVELSVISKNFLFTFFNLFLFFTIIGTYSKMWPVLRDSIKDTTLIAYKLAQSLDGLALFYVNLIILQGIGLFPFRLLEFGSVVLYPINRMGAKTPRDYAELVQPPVFKYGFYLPQTILIFIVCIVYSVLPSGVYILFFGLIYFIIGYFNYKYQLLYAMDHSKHSTGRAWSIIVYRVVLGLVIFQLAMAGELAVKNAKKRALLLIPLLIATIWFGYFYRRSFAPLTRLIALNSIERSEHGHLPTTSEDTIDERRERHMVYANPNMVTPLEPIWIAGKKPDAESEVHNQVSHVNGSGPDVEE